jgi:hypothetical protein
MKGSGVNLRIARYLAASLGSILLIVTLVIISWLYARPKEGAAPMRLRWHMVTKNKIEKGMRVRKDDVTWKLGRVPSTNPLIPVSTLVVGKYASCDIDANSACIPEAFSEFALAEPPRGGVVVPIEVRTSDASSLKPGVHLAFVQQDKGVLPRTTLLSNQRQPGLEVLSMMTSIKDPADTTLLVKVSKGDLDSVALLATGVWRPVILGDPEPATTPEKTKIVRKRNSAHQKRRRH